MSEATPEYCALIVDDDEDVRELCGRALERLNFRCDLAADGVIARNLLRRQRYDVMISDLRMPRKHGHQLATELLKERERPQIIIMSGVNEPRLVEDILTRGALDFVLKPLHYEAFAAKVKALLARQCGMPGQQDSSSLSQFVSSMNIDGRRSHAGRVERLAVAIGKAIGLSGTELEELRLAALLHDIGQFAQPDALRNKPPWTLRPQERQQFEKYPASSAAIVRSMNGRDHVAALIEAHAENFDGSGFPAGHAGLSIPLGARILRLADGCDTQILFATGDELEWVNAHLIEQAGKAYDPDLIPHALQYFTDCVLDDSERGVPVQIDRLQSNMVLAENIYDEQGLFLARKGVRLNADMIARLRHHVHYQSVRVHFSSDASN